jgi:multiple sugar transport system permease protein
MANSLLYSVVAGLGATAVSGLAGYGFARFDFRGSRVMFGALIAVLMVPIAAVTFPLYLVYAKVGLINTIWGMVLPCMVSPVGMYLMRTFVGGAVPVELVEAARIDGAGELKIFVRVGLPLMVPGLVTVLLLSVVGVWNNYFLPLIIFNRSTLYPLTVGLGILSSQANSVNNGYPLTPLVVVGALVSILPLVLLFALLQRYWRGGLLTGSTTSRWCSPSGRLGSDMDFLELDKLVEVGYPRPGLVREQWSDLCGPWEFAFDDDDAGLDESWYEPGTPVFDRTIVVPFPPECRASGIEEPGFHRVVWYRRRVALPPHGENERVLLHLGAVDYEAKVFVDGVFVGSHRGGHTPCSFDITHAAHSQAEIAEIVVRAADDPGDVHQPRGKQDWQEHPHRIWYKPDHRHMAGRVDGGSASPAHRVPRPRARHGGRVRHRARHVIGGRAGRALARKAPSRWGGACRAMPTGGRPQPAARRYGPRLRERVGPSALRVVA